MSTRALKRVRMTLNCSIVDDEAALMQERHGFAPSQLWDSRSRRWSRNGLIHRDRRADARIVVSEQSYAIALLVPHCRMFTDSAQAHHSLNRAATLIVHYDIHALPVPAPHAPQACSSHIPRPCRICIPHGAFVLSSTHSTNACDRFSRTLRNQSRACNPPLI